MDKKGDIIFYTNEKGNVRIEVFIKKLLVYI